MRADGCVPTVACGRPPSAGRYVRRFAESACGFAVAGNAGPLVAGSSAGGGRRVIPSARLGAERIRAGAGTDSGPTPVFPFEDIGLRVANAGRCVVNSDLLVGLRVADSGLRVADNGLRVVAGGRLQLGANGMPNAVRAVG